MTSNKGVQVAVASLLVVWALCLSASGEDKSIAQSNSDGLMKRIESLEHRVTVLEQQCQGSTSRNQGEQAPDISTVPSHGDKNRPSVIRTVPSNGDKNVSAKSTTEIVVTFSKEMAAGGGCSWCTAREGEYPKKTGEPRWTADKRITTMPVKLEPNKTYAMWLNLGERYTNFRDKDGRPAIPYLLVFQTVE